jgi:hypothetical protein
MRVTLSAVRARQCAPNRRDLRRIQDFSYRLCNKEIGTRSPIYPHRLPLDAILAGADIHRLVGYGHVAATCAQEPGAFGPGQHCLKIAGLHAVRTSGSVAHQHHARAFLALPSPNWRGGVFWRLPATVIRCGNIPDLNLRGRFTRGTVAATIRGSGERERSEQAFGIGLRNSLSFAGEGRAPSTTPGESTRRGVDPAFGASSELQVRRSACSAQPSKPFLCSLLNMPGVRANNRSTAG